MAPRPLHLPDWLLGSRDDRVVATTLPAALLASVDALGGDTASLLEAAGIEAEELNDADGRISYRAYLRLCATAMDEYPAPEFSLQFGERLNISALGALGPGLLSCTTCREALELGFEYRTTLGIPTEVYFTVDQYNASIFVERPYRSLLPTRYFRSHVYTIFSCLQHIGRYLLDDYGFGFSKIYLSLEASPYDRTVADYFSCDVISESDRNCVIFAKEVLDRPIKYASPVAKKIARHLCEQLFAKIQRPHSVAQQVAFLVLERLNQPPHLAEVAAQLQMSPRSLSRQLLHEGLTYQALLDELRQANAKLLLEERNLSMGEVALAVGFSDIANFRRAFKKWTNLTPGFYRDHFLDVRKQRGE